MSALRSTVAAWALLAGIAVSHAATAPRVGAAARALHERLVTLDTHLDTPAHFAWRDWSLLDRHDPSEDGSQVDLPRMIEGGLDGGFFAIYTPQGPVTPEGDIAARDAALLRGVAIREVIARSPD